MILRYIYIRGGVTAFAVMLMAGDVGAVDFARAEAVERAKEIESKKSDAERDDERRAQERVTQEDDKHKSRIDKLNQIEKLAVDNDKPALAKRAKKVRDKELKRHDRAVVRFAKQQDERAAQRARMQKKEAEREAREESAAGKLSPPSP